MPPGKSTHIAEPLTFNRVFVASRFFPPGWKPNSTSAKMADATVFKQALKSRVSDFEEVRTYGHKAERAAALIYAHFKKEFRLPVGR